MGKATLYTNAKYHLHVPTDNTVSNLHFLFLPKDILTQASLIKF